MDLDLVKISKKYDENYILKDFSYSFRSNNVYFVIGESGCGKSTLLKVIAQIIDYEGFIYLDNKNIKDIKKDYLSNNVITYIDQNAELLNYLNINQNIDFLINKKIDKKYNQKFKTYSLGEKRRIATYVNTLKNSEIILADEISSSLDKNNALILMNYLREISKNKILIVVTHDLFLINEKDIVINLKDKISFKRNSKKKFKYKNYENKRNNKIFYYSFLKLKDKKDYVFNYISSFIVGLILILLISSLKNGILDFLNKELLSNISLDYLFIEKEEKFSYGFVTELSLITNEGILLMDDVCYDPFKSNIYINVDNVPIYFIFNEQYSMSKLLFEENSKNYNLNINGYNTYIKNINDKEGRIIECPPSFFTKYYKFKGYEINNQISNKAIIKVNKNFILENYEKIIKEYSNIKIKNSGLEAYSYINNMINKINYFLLTFIFISLLITFFLIYTSTNLELIDEKNEIQFMKNIGLSKKKIFYLYYITNLYRGILTFIFTIILYIIMINISNIFMKNQLDINYNILNINPIYFLIIFLIILFIITISNIFTLKKINK